MFRPPTSLKSIQATEPRGMLKLTSSAGGLVLARFVTQEALALKKRVSHAITSLATAGAGGAPDARRHAPDLRGATALELKIASRSCTGNSTIQPSGSQPRSPGARVSPRARRPWRTPRCRPTPAVSATRSAREPYSAAGFSRREGPCFLRLFTKNEKLKGGSMPPGGMLFVISRPHAHL